MQTEFHRISRLPPYVFEQVNKLKAEGMLPATFSLDDPEDPEE